MSTVDTSSQQQPIDNPNKPTPKWKSTSMSSTSSSTTNTQKPPRKVDRELQRIKSLAVVSGLNKQFSQEPQSMSPMPSISTTTSGAANGGGYNNHYHHSHYVPHRPATVCGLSSDMRPFGARSQRSSSISSSHSRHSTSRSKATTTIMSNQRHKKTIELDELEKELLNMFEQAYLQRSQEQRVDNWVVSVMPPASDVCSVDDTAAASHMEDTPLVTTPPDDARVAKRSSSRLSLGRDSIISENGGYQQRIRELESLYMTTLKKLNQSEQKHTQWEQHIQQTIAAYIEEKELEADRARQLAKVVVKQELIMEQMELHMHQVTAAAATESPTKQEEEQAKQTLHQLKNEIQELRDTRAAMENDISLLRRELDAEQRLLEQTWEASKTLTAECNDQRVQITEKLDTLRRQVMEKDMLLHKVYMTHRDVVPERPARNSNRDSKQQRRSTATPRWTGGPLPPQAPPPTDPLPPVPMSPTPQQQQQQPEEVLSNSSKRPSISSSAGGASSCFEDPETEAAYREFAEQLQSRLSVSKEIDDLRVWQPADLDEFQKRMSRWSDMDEEDIKRQSLASSLRSKEGAAFWRGMKKKLRV
ncbi:hypothetical protein LRAMOSA04987 [Lichtheimia ramosa]|uniref:Uncharacterized protein n=1 Tax=Lichtheimia ramosa TaxID=688394 RepID=A0A077X0Q9_9FUNG|nr:hypothetical protein LRAMOSA04987 [Lichtheimia ramosa]